MPLSLSLEVIDGFRAVARNLANHLYNADFGGNYFRVDALNARLPAYEVGDVLTCYCTSWHSQIIFSQIEPVDIISMKVGTPVRFNEHETDMTLRVWNNASDDSPKETLEIQEELKITEIREILAEISMAIRSKFGAKSPAFEASLEAELSSKLGVNLKHQEERRKLKDYTLNLTIQPWTNTSISQRHSVADVRQRIEMKCLADARVTLISQGDEPRWSKEFESMLELENYMRGGGGGRDENADALNRIVNTRQFQDYFVEKDNLTFDIEQERISRNVQTGETDRKDVPIVNPNAVEPGKAKRRGRRKRKRNE